MPQGCQEVTSTRTRKDCVPDLSLCVPARDTRLLTQVCSVWPRPGTSSTSADKSLSTQVRLCTAVGTLGTSPSFLACKGWSLKGCPTPISSSREVQARGKRGHKPWQQGCMQACRPCTSTLDQFLWLAMVCSHG